VSRTLSRTRTPHSFQEQPGALNSPTESIRNKMTHPMQSDLAKLLEEALDDFETTPPPPPAPAGAIPDPNKVLRETCVKEAEAIPPPQPSVPGTTELSATLDADTVDVTESRYDSGLEKTLGNLAISAEALSETKCDEGSAAEEEAMMRLLQQISAGMGADGAADGAVGTDDSMMKLFQQLSAATASIEPEGAAASAGREAKAGVLGCSTDNGGSDSCSTSGTASEHPGLPPDRSGDSDAAMEGLLDQLVNQLLSKDVMLEPMKHLHAEFPQYLATHQSTLSTEELSRYQRQQALVGKILNAYEDSPPDTDKVATLMQEMQACGPPPAAIAGPAVDNAGCVVS